MGVKSRYITLRGGIKINAPLIKNPLQIFGSSLFDWWRPEEIIGDNGDPQPIWTSQGANGAIFSSPPGNEPTITDNVINNYKALSFNGITDYMEISTGDISDYNFMRVSQSYTFFIFKTKSKPGELLNSTDLVNVNRKGIRYTITPGPRILTYRRGATTPTVLTPEISPPLNNNTVNLIEFQNDIINPISNEWGKIIINNSIIYENTSTTQTIIDEPPNGFMNLGKTINNTLFSEMDVLEIMIIKKIPSIQERINTLKYLTNKYKILYI